MKEPSSFWIAAGGGILLLTMFVGAAIYAQNPRTQSARPPDRAHGCGGRAGMMHGMLLRGLDLSDQQRDQIKQVLSQRKDRIQVLMQQNLDARLALDEAIIRGADPDTLAKLQKQLADAEWQGTRLKTELWAGVSPILSDAQKSQLQQNLHDMSQRHFDFMSRWGQ